MINCLLVKTNSYYVLLYYFNYIIDLILAISKEEADDTTTRGQLPYNGYSEEFLDRLEPNGNIPVDKDRRYGESQLKAASFIILEILFVQYIYLNVRIF